MVTDDRGAGRGPSLAGAAWPAALVAGPVFCTAAMLASLYMHLPHVIAISLEDLAGFLVILVAACIFGTLVSFPPILAAIAMLRWLGSRVVPARSQIAWFAFGGAAGAGFAQALGMNFGSGEITFAIVVTTLVCALVAQRRLYGAPPQFKEEKTFPFTREVDGLPAAG